MGLLGHCACPPDMVGGVKRRSNPPQLEGIVPPKAGRRFAPLSGASLQNDLVESIYLIVGSLVFFEGEAVPSELEVLGG